MFCSRCGTEVVKATQFCPSCGLDLRVTTPIQAIATGDVTELDIVREALNAEYELLEELGRGGMAIVLRAMDRHLEREVAIKVLPFSLAFDADFVERFQREARTAAQLEHPNIIPIYRVGKSGRVIYFVMKFLRGSSLSRILHEKRKIPPADIRKMLGEVGSALGYAATRGVVHRDIKPDNIMFDEFGQCVVTDFGIAKAGTSSRLTGSGMSIGTPHYMSPEQARAQAIDGRSDIYSLGIVAYQCLVGEVPYDGEDSFAIGYKHIMEPIPSPPLATPEEKRLFEIIRKMIMKDPQDRYQDAEGLINALEGGMGSTPRRPTASQIVNAALPTSPMPASPGEFENPQVVITPGSRRSVARPSIARPASSHLMLGVVWGALVVAAVGLGFLYIRSRASSATTPPPVVPDTTTHAALPDPNAKAESLRVLTDSALRPDTQHHAADTTHPGVVIGAPSSDSGSLHLSNLPKGSQVMVDNKALTDPETRLPAGFHELGITAPKYTFYLDTIEIKPGQQLSLTPVLTPLGIAPLPKEVPKPLDCTVPGPANRFGRACYDKPPRPDGSARVPLTDVVQGTPSPAVLLVKVSVDGKTLVVQANQPSNDPVFEDLAQSFARQLKWIPAQKNGAPVEGWTQFAFYPADR
jgi:serine/threonine-protein kinase